MNIIEQIQKQQAEQRDMLLAELDTVTKAAAEASEKGAGARQWASDIGATLEIMAWADSKDRNALAVTKYLARVKGELDALGGTDRMDGDLLASTLLAGVIGLGSEQPELVARVNQAVDAWRATVPQTVKRAGSGGRGSVDRSKPGLAWKCSCGLEGEDRTNSNSAKSGYLTHLASSKNGHGFTSRPTGDNPVNAIVQKAFKDAEANHGESKTSTQFSAPDGKLYQVTVKWFPGDAAPEVVTETPEVETAAA